VAETAMAGYRENTFHHPGVAETAMAGWKVIGYPENIF
jgi:hypothetical protein